MRGCLPGTIGMRITLGSYLNLFGGEECAHAARGGGRMLQRWLMSVGCRTMVLGTAAGLGKHFRTYELHPALPDRHTQCVGRCLVRLGCGSRWALS
jgi:hypothetical protein